MKHKIRHKSAPEIKVLQICHDYKGPFRHVACQYAKAFSDCEVTTIFLKGARSDDIAEQLEGKVIFLELGKDAFRGLKLNAVVQIKRLIALAPPDLVIAHRYKSLFIALLLDYQLPITLVLGVMHAFGFLDKKTRALSVRLWKSNVHLIGVSEPVSQAIRIRYPKLAQENRIHVIENAVEPDTALDPVTARNQLGIPLGKFCYGAVGRLTWQKNHGLLIDAFSRLDTDNALLAIVGDGKLKQELADMAESLGVGNRVIFCGQKENARHFMRAFDTFVFPSSTEEAFGVVLLEAMQAGVPILSSDALGPVYVLGETAKFFTCDDVDSLCVQLQAMRDLSPDERKVLTESACALVARRYSPDVIANKLRNLPAVKTLMADNGQT